jgi:hypothetical protein
MDMGKIKSPRPVSKDITHVLTQDAPQRTAESLYFLLRWDAFVVHEW